MSTKFESMKREFSVISTAYFIEGDQSYGSELWLSRSAYKIACKAVDSVLQKCISTQTKRVQSYNDYTYTQLNLLYDLKNSACYDEQKRERELYDTCNSFGYGYDAEGCIIEISSDPVAEAGMKNCANDSYSEGMELIQVAIEGLMSECHKAVMRGEKVIDLDSLYDTPAVRNSTYTRTGHKKPNVGTEVTTPIREVYKAVRKFISNMSSVQFDNSNPYVYLEDIISYDSDSDGVEDAEVTTYERQPNWYTKLTVNHFSKADRLDLACQLLELELEESDSDGTMFYLACKLLTSWNDDPIVTNDSMCDDIFELIYNLHLRKSEYDRLVYKISNDDCSYREIAAHFGVSEQAVNKTFQSIKRKVLDSDYISESAKKSLR